MEIQVLVGSCRLSFTANGVASPLENGNVKRGRHLIALSNQQMDRRRGILVHAAMIDEVHAAIGSEHNRQGLQVRAEELTAQNSDAGIAEIDHDPRRQIDRLTGADFRRTRDLKGHARRHRRATIMFCQIEFDWAGTKKNTRLVAPRTCTIGTPATFTMGNCSPR